MLAAGLNGLRWLGLARMISLELDHALQSGPRHCCAFPLVYSFSYLQLISIVIILLLLYCTMAVNTRGGGGEGIFKADSRISRKYLNRADATLPFEVILHPFVFHPPLPSVQGQL